MKKLNVNEDACIGCGACISIDPEHFDFNEDGLSEVINNENIDTENTINAIESCPTSAISYVESNGKNEHENSDCHCENCNCEDCHCDGDECQCENCS